MLKRLGAANCILEGSQMKGVLPSVIHISVQPKDCVPDILWTNIAKVGCCQLHIRRFSDEGCAAKCDSYLSSAWNLSATLFGCVCAG